MSTLERTRVIVRAICRQAIDEDYLDENSIEALSLLHVQIIQARELAMLAVARGINSQFAEELELQLRGLLQEFEREDA